MSPMRHRREGLTVLWRGSLASCNYGCSYCPFAKTIDDRQALVRDRAALERFADWATSRAYPVAILMTPWGEGLIRKYYREAMIAISQAANIETVAIQTNLSCSVQWFAKCDLTKAALWTTFHPGETPLDAFADKIARLSDMNARFSVGVVGLNEHLEAIEALRARLPDKVYLWINAYKRVEGYYAAETIERMVAIDPLFEINNRVYASAGRPCCGGETAISVLADGTARRCHFIETPMGNIYDADFETNLVARPCSASECRCHIGYSHMPDLDLKKLFGRGFLERNPQRDLTRRDARTRIRAFDCAKPKTQA